MNMTVDDTDEGYHHYNHDGRRHWQKLSSLWSWRWTKLTKDIIIIIMTVDKTDKEYHHHNHDGRRHWHIIMIMTVDDTVKGHYDHDGRRHWQRRSLWLWQKTTLTKDIIILIMTVDDTDKDIILMIMTVDDTDKRYHPYDHDGGRHWQRISSL